MAGPKDSVHVFYFRPGRARGQGADLGLGHWQRPAFAAAGPVMMGGTSASGLRRRLPAAPLGYTRNVPTWSHRLTCLALGLALSGSPAVLAACMALCVDSPMTTAGHLGHGALESEVVPEAASHVHHDHGAAAAPTTEEPATHLAVAPQASDARLMATCSDCCLDGGSMPAAGLRAERRDGDAASEAATARLAPFDLSGAVQAASPPGPPIPPSAPARTPLALRI